MPASTDNLAQPSSSDPPSPSPSREAKGGGPDPHPASRSGLFFGLGAYLWWGFMPLYFKLVNHVPPLIVVAHRIVWSVVFLLAIVAAQHRWRELRAALRSWRTVGGLALSALFIATNWVVYITAIQHKQVMQASLGYYINPLVFVLLALVFLGERLRGLQWVSVTVAGVGVAIATLGSGAFPWIAVTLAISFALYGFARKLVAVTPMIGLLVETLVLLPAALGVLMWMGPGWTAGTPGTGGSGGGLSRDQVVLALAGVVTSVPLLWFAAAVRRLRLSTLGFLQYVSPTTKFLVAVYGMGESLDRHKLLSFGFIWAALAVFTYDAWRNHRPPATAAVEIVE